VIEYVPAVVIVGVAVAVPEASVPVPMEVEPLRKVTVPVGVPDPVEGATVAVKVKDWPAVGAVVGRVSVVVVAVPPDEPLGACQKSPQPARNGAVASPSNIRIFPRRTALGCIGRPLSWVRKMDERSFCLCF
jgi:hypothetical protein